MIVIGSARALRDLEELDAQGRGQLVGDLTARSFQRDTFPDSGRSGPEFANRYIRELIEGNYRLIYERFADRVEILAVIHGRGMLET